MLERSKWSRLYRKVNRKSIDQGIAGPPSFFTRRRDGIPVPTLDKFMQGYTNIFKMRLSSKTLENSFLVMNRQVWTNQKQHLSTVQNENIGEAVSDRCGFCGQQKPQCTCCLSVVGMQSPCGPSCSRALMPSCRREVTTGSPCMPTTSCTIRTSLACPGPVLSNSTLLFKRSKGI